MNNGLESLQVEHVVANSSYCPKIIVGGGPRKIAKNLIEDTISSNRDSDHTSANISRYRMNKVVRCQS
jgi:hypothetical protein